MEKLHSLKVFFIKIFVSISAVIIQIILFSLVHKIEDIGRNKFLKIHYFARKKITLTFNKNSQWSK